MKKCDKVILILYFRDLEPKVYVFNTRKLVEDFVLSRVSEFEQKKLYKYDIYFGFLAEHFEE